MRMGLSLGCVISWRQFNMYIDGVVRELYNRVNGMGVCMSMGRVESVAFC